MAIPISQPSRDSGGLARAFAAFLQKLQVNPARLGFLGDVWSLAKPYWVSAERTYARRMFALLLVIKFAGIWICVQQNHWYADFYAAIQSREVDAFLKQIGIFVLIAGGFITSLVSSHWVAESLKLRWRNWLVQRTTNDWLTNRAYYRLQLEDRPGTNPDQRIVEDLGLFAGQSINLVVGFLDVSVSLIAFTSILWSLSGTLTFGAISIGGYMVFAVFGYTVLASWLTHQIGRPLVALLTANQNLESDFRYGLVRLRENAETVAFYRGEGRENAMLHERWGQVVQNFREIMRRERAIAWFTHAHGQVSIVLPFLLASPRYFSGQITFAQVMQVAAACGSVQACLNFFIASYGQIALWQATTERLVTFRSQLDEALAQEPDAVKVVRTGGGLVVRDLTLSLPDRTNLVSDLNLAIEAGEAVLIKGASGTGKSTMLRAVAGIWPHASGSVSLGSGDVFFVPQKPYLPLGTLRQAAFYPAAPAEDDAEIRRVLTAVKLGHLIDHLDEIDHWSLRLSGGEQQRLGFARVFLTRPQTVFLDEATSALDEETEGHLYQMLRDADWKPTIVSIGHRSTLASYHDTTVELKRAA